MSALTYYAAAFCVIAGLAVFIAKPDRFTNRVFLLTSLITAAWLVTVGKSIQIGILFIDDHTITPRPWLQANGALFALVAWCVFLLTGSIVTRKGHEIEMIRSSVPWLIFSMLLAALSFTDYYIPPDSKPGFDKRGPLYFSLIIVGHILFIILLFKALRLLKTQRGIQRIETQFISLNLCIAFLVVLILLTLGTSLNAQALRRSTVFIIAAAFGLAAWAIMFHRVFNAPQILTSLLQRILIILAWVGGLQLCLLLLGGMSAPYDVLFISVAAISAVVFYLDRESRTWLQLGGERELAQLRSAILSLGRSESDQARLVPGCEDLVCKRYGARFAELLVDGGAVFGGMRMRLPKGSAAFAGLAHAGWATPEALERQRTTPETQELNRFLHENSIAAIVAVPRGSPTPSLLIALGEKNDGWPVTYPEIERLTNVAELIDNVLLHARLAAEAALKAQVEHLAMMSRGLAHDLKNLITPISSFLIHAEPRIIAGTVEAEVHDSASRSVAIINDYISEALFFGTRLELRLEPTAVPALVQTVMNITASRAARRRVTVVSQPIEGQAHIDRVLIQRMLANLVNNAIDASKPGTMVTLSATRAGMGLQFAVADSGSGISAENRARIFEPYFTTKQMGDDARGFGLGLTICDKVVRLHGGIIRVESEPGRGTTMTVEFPSAFAPVRPATVAGNAPTTVMHAQSS